MASARSLMLQGTGSDVGKSLVVAGLCRVYHRRGLKVLPFKPQNMSNNAAVAEDGGEIGRAQWLQARAAGVAPSVHMNPVLLKPESDTGAQVILRGKPFAIQEARDYQARRAMLLQPVFESFEKLKAEADLVLVEGAGSASEVNLRQGDIANMGFAVATNTPVVLIGDINRGGVIASVVGTHSVVSAEDRALIQGYIINQFRGDVSLFDAGLDFITERTNWPTFGVIPFVPAARSLPAEDAMVLQNATTAPAGKKIIAVPMLSRIANFDDLDPLRAEPDVEVRFVSPGEPLPGDATLVVLPGSKATIRDLQFFKAQGWDIDLLGHVRRGGHVLGICGGYQMLGRVVRDPDGIEGIAGDEPGLGLLDVETVIAPEKIVRNVECWSPEFERSARGYEIHAGETEGPDCDRPFLMRNNQSLGAISKDGRVQGAYVHGLLQDDGFRRAFLATLGIQNSDLSFDKHVERALDELADALEASLDIDGLLKVAR